MRREACTTCGKCAAACPSGALQIIGRPMTVDAVMEEVMKDLPFFRVSKGGLTVTGGEPLAQPEFLAALLRATHDAGLSTCVETSGYAPWECFEPILNCTDYFLYDIKESDPERHQIYTGAGPERIWDNLGRLNASGAQIILRCPIIPGFNDRIDHFAQIGRLAQAHAHVLRVEVEPYHPLGISKARNIGMICQMQPIPLPTDEDTGNWIAQIAKWTDKPVRRA